MSAETPHYRQMTPEELAAQKRRNRWLALALVAFFVLAFIITISRIRDGIYWRMPEHSSDIVSKPDPDFVPFEERTADAPPVMEAAPTVESETEEDAADATPETSDE